MKEIPENWGKEFKGNKPDGKYLCIEGVNPEWADQVRMSVSRDKIEEIKSLAKDSESAEKMIEILERFVADAVDQTWTVAFARGVWTCQNFATESKFEYVPRGGEEDGNTSSKA
ncbi:MAG: hypothetical protein ACD_58C00292G0004 [uncultured bacterium]|nr:MAG: hypothetical protein ACD_58C00292G0004 [uncultured bacterium]